MQFDSSQAAHSPVKHRKDVNIASGNVRKYASRPFKGLGNFQRSEKVEWPQGKLGKYNMKRLRPLVTSYPPNSAVFGLFPIVMVAKPDMT